MPLLENELRATMLSIISALRWLEGLLRPRTRVPPEAAGTVLVLQFMAPLGVLVHTTPLFEALKRGRPGMIVAVATRGPGLEVLRHSPFVDHLIELPDPMRSYAKAAEALHRALKARRIGLDCCVTPVSERRTRVALLAAQVCNGWRGGFTAHTSLYQHALEVDDSLSQIGNNLRLAHLLGCTTAPLEPKVFFSAADVTAARRLLAPIRRDNRPVLLLVTQGSGGQRTAWHDDRWVAVLQHAADALGYAVAFAGTAADAQCIDKLNGAAGGVGTSLAGRTSVCELAAALALSDMVISLDTGTMHVARAVGVPMIVLGPSWQKPVEWLPLGLPHVTILRGPDRADVPEGYRLDEISANMVVEALDRITTSFPAGEASREARLAAGLSELDHLRR